jgi:osmotically-inducible protein OsmY
VAVSKKSPSYKGNVEKVFPKSKPSLSTEAKEVQQVAPNKTQSSLGPIKNLLPQPNGSVNHTGAEVDQLRALLVGPEIFGLTKARQLIEGIQHQLQNPEELVKLIVPVFNEALTRKVAESGNLVAEAIAPIIDEVIRKKIEQDKVAIPKTLGPVISDSIKKQIESSREEIVATLTPVVSASISKMAREASDEIAKALAPVIGAAIKEQVNSQRDTVVDALYPVIGSTIAKYMSESIKNLVNSINRNIQDTFTLKGLSRKAHAKIQGVSEAELILKDSLVCIPQAVFLIHKISGLLIAQAQKPEAKLAESEMAAGMLTAIRSFANDWIARSGNVSELDAINYGDSKIILEVAGYCYLAVIIEGEPNEEFLSQMRKTLRRIVEHFGKSIENFDGDPTTVPEEVKSAIEELIRKQDDLVKVQNLPRSRLSQPSRFVQYALPILLCLIIIPWGSYWYKNRIDRNIEARVRQSLISMPELAVYNVSVNAQRDTLWLSGMVPNEYLRQKVEQIAKKAAPTLNIKNGVRAVEVPADPVLAAAEVKRVTTVLNQVEGVFISTSYKEGHVAVEGTIANPSDATTIAQTFEKIPGVRTVRINISPVGAKPSKSGEALNQKK